MHRCPTLVRAARLPSTSLTSVRTCCRSSLVCTAVYIRMRCSSAVNITELHSYALQNLVCMCRCPTFLRATPPPSTSLTYVRTRCRTSLEFTTVLHSYALLVCRQHRRPPFVRVAEPHWYAPLSYIRKRYSTAVYIVTYARTRCRTSLVFSAVLHSYALHVCRLHRDLRSYALQNLVGIHLCPTFVRAAHLPSTSPTSVRTRCRTSLVCTAVLHS